MEKPNNKCIKCCYVIKGSPIFFSCSHLLCPYCYLSQLFKSNFTFFQLQKKNEISSQCPFCNQGTLNISMISFLSYLKCNEYTNAICKKHNKETELFCNKCELDLCSDCINMFHKDYFPSHKLYKNSYYIGLTKFCPFHTKKKNKYKCEECQKYLCSECFKTIHHEHNCIKIDDLISRAIKRIKFKEYDYYIQFLNSKEIEIKDQINYDKQKNIELIDKCINDLIQAKKQYLQDIKDIYEDLNILFNFNRQIYYYYYTYINTNNDDINPILIYDKLNNDKDKKLKNKKIFNFLNTYLKPNYTIPYFEKIQILIKEFTSKQPYDLNISRLYMTSKHKFYLTKEINNIRTIDSVTSIAVFPDQDNKYAVSTISGFIHLFSLSPPYKKIASFKGHDKSISKLLASVNTDPKLLISASFDKTIHFYDMTQNNGEIVQNLKGHKGEITSLIELNTDDANHPNEGNILIASGSKDKNIKIWSVLECKCKKTLTGHKAPVLALAQIKKDAIISSGEDYTLIVWNIITFETEKSFDLKEQKSLITCILKYDNDKVIFNGEKGQLKCFNYLSMKEIGEFKKHNDYITGLVHLKKTNQVASCSKDQKICLWDIENKLCDCVISGHTGSINTMSIGCWGINQIITGGDDGEVIIWENAY